MDLLPTSEPNEVVAPLHDRMAVVLGADEEAAWLDADDPDERAALLDTPDPDPFESFPVSDRINDPAAEGPELADPVDAPDEDPQAGLGEFG